MNFKEIEEYIQKKRQSSKAPSISICVFDSEKVLYANAFGFRNLELGLSATPYTIYGVGSITKSVTALCVLQLYEKGLLDLNDTVSQHLKSFGFDDSLVTIKHLLTHTSGMPSLGVAERIIAQRIAGEKSGVTNFDEFIGLLKRVNRVFRPGERFLYSNEGYMLLGKIVETVSGERYEDYVLKRVIKPLALVRTGFTLNGYEDVMTPYLIKTLPERSVFPNHSLLLPAGGLVSCVVELAQYARNFIVENESLLLTKQLLEEATRPHVKTNLPTLLEEEWYGYGWQVAKSFLGQTLVSHSGNIAVCSAYLGFLKDAKIGVALASNSATAPLAQIALYTLSLLLEKDPKKELSFVFLDELLDSFCGVYESFSGSTLVVRRSGYSLYAEITTQFGTERTALLPGKDFYSYYIPSYSGNIPVEFFTEKGEMRVLVERNLFKKISNP
ncbi:hypothetical protein B9Q02_07430 [Candidatus Marsarchaeota G1 archaeon BE_D]|uniref:Beta-lactamase-related domain-containing protein n=1 Tax=Candidatus Marsarchaeota G1 archaeon BE_D TaxID=1978156 RepID=A0A2R6AFI5_9ARCH|nr:MAG: hypothetical protein B9Q02_07430 [Candidatus Marsarchaeota G1 archaeon BE_D]